MASPVTCDLVIAATFLGGILAGATFDRMIVQMPAWRRIGSRAWAEYSRKADLGNGLVFYPLVAIGGAVLSIAAAVAFHFDQTVPRSTAVPIYGAAVLVIGGLLATIKAAPKMLSLRRIDDDNGLLEALKGFHRWSLVRAVPQVLAFVANLWSLVSLL
jgi:hypothetical protein